MAVIVAAFYHFFDFADFVNTRTPLLETMQALDIKGSVLLAPEGVNGTISGSRESINAFIAHLQEKITHAPITVKESEFAAHPFRRAKVRLKKETISLGEKVDISQVGEYVTPQDWNALIASPDTIIIDTRNDYEVHLGTFAGARNPKIKNFKELPAYMRAELAGAKDKKIATFCTGGIRCEKFTAWLKQEGYEHVYHLQGGILKYLEEIPPQQSTWQGECYVFDERVAVGHGLAPTISATACPACGHTLTPEDRAHPHYQKDAACPFCHPLAG